MIKTFTLALATLTTGLAASAAIAASPADNSQKICKEIEITGSRLSRRVCKTAAEWEASPLLSEVRTSRKNGKREQAANIPRIDRF